MLNSDLVRDVAVDKVVLFLGAGVSSSASIQGKSAFQGWGDFLKVAAASRDVKLRNQIVNLIEQKDFLLACQLLQDSYGEEWQDLVTAEYGKAAEPSNLHEAILSLRQRVIITTNFDKLIETAWTRRMREGERNFKVVSNIDNGVFRVLRDLDTPYLIKIHGSVDNASALVFSRSDYIRMAFGNENTPPSWIIFF